MKILKISQLQIQGLEEPVKNAELIKENLLKTIPFNPDIISTPECSNIITSDRAHLFKYATYQSKCPVLDVCLKFAKKYQHNLQFLLSNLGYLVISNSKYNQAKY